MECKSGQRAIGWFACKHCEWTFVAKGVIEYEPEGDEVFIALEGTDCPLCNSSDTSLFFWHNLENATERWAGKRI